MASSLPSIKQAAEAIGVFTNFMPILLSTPDVLMLLTSSCPHCPAVLVTLSNLVKRGVIGRLEIVNIGTHPDVAEQHGVRSVPWVRIGEFELSGVRSPAELERWAQRAGSVQGRADYLSEMLKNGLLPQANAVVDAHEAYVDALLWLLADTQTDMHVQVGIGAIFEHLQNSDVLRRHIEALGALTRHTDARVRADACHYLSFSGDVRALQFIEPLLNDADDQVRDIARESVESLRS